MNHVFSLSVWAWVIAVAVVLTLALYRLVMTWGKYTVLHVRRSEVSLIPEQILHERRLSKVDFWGQLLTWAVLVVGLILALMYLIPAALAIERQ